MSQRVAARVAWCLWALSLLLLTLASVLEYLNRGDSNLAGWLFRDAISLVFWSLVMSVGTLVAARRPSNPIGWLFCAGWCLLAFGGSGNFAEQYATYGLLTQPNSVPAALALAWLGPIARAVGFIPLVTFVPLIFPTGRLPSTRWRPVAYLALALLACGGLYLAAIDHANARLIALARPP